MTQKELGERLRTDQTTVSAWELDKPVKLAGPSLVALADLLQTTPEAILTGKGWALPVTGPGESRSLVAEAYGNDLIQLPVPAEKGALIWIPRNAPAEIQELDLRHAQARLRKALTEGRAVWIVVEE